MENCELVSIIMPAYNCETYIAESIESVLEQTYTKWELLIVDDCSSDNTRNVIEKYAAQDQRIKLIGLKENMGAAVARNTAIEEAQGTYLAFLDSDDLWKKNKLEVQIEFMRKNEHYFSCTSYGKINEHGEILDTVIQCKNIYDYNAVLKECPGNSTIIYNAEKLGKFYAEDIRRRNDFVMWLKVIKTAKQAYGIKEVLTYHRIRNGSISYNKGMLLRYQWYVYRKIEKLSFLRAVYLMLLKILQTIKRKSK